MRDRKCILPKKLLRSFPFRIINNSWVSVFDCGCLVSNARSLNLGSTFVATWTEPLPDTESSMKAFFPLFSKTFSRSELQRIRKKTRRIVSRIVGTTTCERFGSFCACLLKRKKNILKMRKWNSFTIRQSFDSFYSVSAMSRFMHWNGNW